MAIDWDKLVVGPLVETFGEPVMYTSPRLGTFNITGVFDEAYLELTPLGRGSMDATESFALGSPGAITTSMPVLGVQLSQFVRPPRQGDQLLVRGEIFYVKEVRPDGKGGAKLMLNFSRRYPC